MIEMLPEEMGEEEPRSSQAELMDEGYDYHRPRRGDIRKGTVVRIDSDAIIVDIGGKRDGIVPSRDLDRLGPEVVAQFKVGDEVRVYVMNPETRDGDTIVSLNLARQAMDWDRAQELMDSGEIFEGEVSGYNKGGLLVPFGRLQGFLPASQIANLNGRIEAGSHLERLGQLVGKALPLKVIEVSRHRRRLIVSERAAQREWRAQQRERLFEDITEGETRQGVVSNLCDFGAFVDLGGADGLIHISELAWNRVKHPREVLKIGQEVEVFVLKVDRERQRIALSLKRLQADPWRTVEEKYYVGQVVQGTITNIVKFGAFAEIEPGIEGLIHLSELVEGGAQEPSEVVYEGEELPLQVVSIDSARQRIGLSLRRASPELRDTAEEEEGAEAVAEVELEQVEDLEFEEEGVSPFPQEVGETSEETALVAVGAEETEEIEADTGEAQEEPEEEVGLPTDGAMAEETEVATEEVGEEPEEEVGLPTDAATAEETEVATEEVGEEPEEEVGLPTDAATAEEAEVATEEVGEEPEEEVGLPTDGAMAEEAEVAIGEVGEEPEEEVGLPTDAATAEEAEVATEEVGEEPEEEVGLPTDAAMAEETEVATEEVGEDLEEEVSLPTEAEVTEDTPGTD